MSLADLIAHADLTDTARALLTMVVERGDARLFVDVRRDYDNPRLTLRGSGEAWGV